mgnify:CR=1 FL=1
MQNTTNFLAADLGASNGRVLLARWNGERFDLDPHGYSNLNPSTGRMRAATNEG